MTIRLPTSNEASRLSASKRLRSFRWIALVVFLLCLVTLFVAQRLHPQLAIPSSLGHEEAEDSLVSIVLDTGIPPANSTLGEVININQSIALAFRATALKDYSPDDEQLVFDSLEAALMTKHTAPGSLMLWQICPENKQRKGQRVPDISACVYSEFLPIPLQPDKDSFVWSTWTPSEVVKVSRSTIYWAILSSDATQDESSLIWIDSDKGTDPWGTAFSDGNDNWVRDRDGSISVPSVRVLIR